MPQERDARLVADYLYVAGVEVEVIDAASSGGEWELWVVEEDQLQAARQGLQEYRETPTDARFGDAEGRADQMRRQHQREEKRTRNRVVDVRTGWAGGRFGPRGVTAVLIAMSALVALLTHLGDRPEPLVSWLSIASYEVSGGYVRWSGLREITEHWQLWRLFTPALLHFGFMHLIFNMFWLADLGALVESRRGSRFLALQVLTLAALSNLGQYALAGPNFGGMSGVVYGLLGYVWVKGRLEPASRMQLRSSTMTIMLIWLGLGVVGVLGGIANGAHAYGLAAGVVMGAARHWRRWLPKS